jgi:thiol:disulfide interchange protein
MARDQHTPRNMFGGGLMSTAVAGAAIVIAIVATYRILGGPAPTPPGFAGDAPLQAAIDHAARADRVVVAVATADWCAPCQAYKRGGLAAREVNDWLAANAETVLIDVTDGATTDSERLQVRCIPATYVIADGMILGGRIGAMDAEELLAWLRETAAARPARAEAPPEPKPDPDADQAGTR